MSALEDWELRIRDLEQRLRPIAERPVDVTRPGWLERLQASGSPLDEAGAGETTERLLSEIIVAYSQGAEDFRAAVRRLFDVYRSFAWAAILSVPRTSVRGLRQHLILFSIKDQGRDGRDALLTLWEICCDALAASVEIESVLREVAAMSSDADRFGMGSTRQMLLRFLRVSKCLRPTSS